MIRNACNIITATDTDENRRMRRVKWNTLFETCNIQNCMDNQEMINDENEWMNENKNDIPNKSIEGAETMWTT